MTAARRVFEAPDDQDKLARELAGEGKVYLQLGDFQQALAVTRRALAIYRAIGGKEGIINTLNNSGSIFMAQGLTDRAMDYRQQALAVAGDDAGWQAYLFHNIANVYARRGERDKAIEWMSKSIAAAEKVGDRPNLAAGLMELGGIHLQNGQLDVAEDELAPCAQDLRGNRRKAAADGHAQQPGRCAPPTGRRKIAARGPGVGGARRGLGARDGRASRYLAQLHVDGPDSPGPARAGPGARGVRGKHRRHRGCPWPPRGGRRRSRRRSWRTKWTPTTAWSRCSCRRTVRRKPWRWPSGRRRVCSSIFSAAAKLDLAQAMTDAERATRPATAEEIASLNRQIAAARTDRSATAPDAAGRTRTRNSPPPAATREDAEEDFFIAHPGTAQPSSAARRWRPGGRRAGEAARRRTKPTVLEYDVADDETFFSPWRKRRNAAPDAPPIIQAQRLPLGRAALHGRTEEIPRCLGRSAAWAGKRSARALGQGFARPGPGRVRGLTADHRGRRAALGTCPSRH